MRGSSPSIASLSNIDIYTIWGMMGKPISRGGLFGGGQNNIFHIKTLFIQMLRLGAKTLYFLFNVLL